MTIAAQVLTAVALVIIAGDFSAIYGRWAYSLSIPAASFAQWSFLFVPVIVLLAFVLPRRIPLWLRVLTADLVALGFSILPVVIFTLGSHTMTFTSQLPTGLTGQLRSELGFPVIMVNDSHGSHLHFPRSHDPSLVRDAVRRQGLEPRS